MSFRSIGRRAVRRVLATPAAERDPSFQDALEAQTRRGMVLTAALGLFGVALFVGIHLASGSRPVWLHGTDETASVSLADKTLIAALCLVLLAIARTSLVRTWGRPLLAAAMVAGGLAMALDDVVRGDFSFTAAWLVLVLLVAVGTVPYTPRQALGLAMAMLVIYAVTLSVTIDGLAPHLHDHRIAFFVLSIVIVVSLSSYLYATRYGQHQALQRAERLRAQLEERTHELERSLADLSAAQDQLVRHEKLAALGQLTAGVAHEIQNPLNFVVNFATLSRDLVGEVRQALAAAPERPVGEALPAVEEPLADLARNAALIDEHGQNAARIVRRMMEHAQAAPGERAETDLNAFVEGQVEVALGRLHARAGGDGAPAVRVERDYADDAGRVRLDPREMRAVLLNLLDNAFRAALDAGHDGRPPRVRVRTRRGGGRVEFRVEDNGPGVPEEVRPRLFEPFFTTRPPGEGTGLGLSLAFDAVTHGHGGTLTVEAGPDGGAAFVVGLPA